MQESDELIEHNISNEFNHQQQQHDHRCLLTQASPTFAGVAASSGTTTTPSSEQSNVAIVQSLAAKYGWGSGPEWQALTEVINRESGFNNNAQNPTSTAYGIFQFLDSTWTYGGIAKTSNPTLQTEAGLLYIKARYGDPIAAEAHEQAYGWY